MRIVNVRLTMTDPHAAQKTGRFEFLALNHLGVVQGPRMSASALFCCGGWLRLARVRCVTRIGEVDLGRYRHLRGFVGDLLGNAAGSPRAMLGLSRLRLRGLKPSMIDSKVIGGIGARCFCGFHLAMHLISWGQWLSGVHVVFAFARTPKLAPISICHCNC